MNSKTTTIEFTQMGTYGTIIAIVISWSINHSVGWAVLHGLFGWFYVIYYCLGYGGLK